MSDALTILRNYVKNKKDFTEDDERIIFNDICYPKNVKTTYIIYGTGKDGKPKDYYTLECLAFLIKNRDLQHPLYVKNAGTRSISVVSRPDRRELLSYLDGEVETSSSIDRNAPLEIAMQRPQPYVKTPAVLSNLASGSIGVGGSSVPSALLGSNANNLNSSSLSSSTNKRLHEEDDSMASSSKKMSLDSLANDNDVEMKASSQAMAKDDFIDRIAKKFDENQSTRAITDNIVPLSSELTIEKIASLKAKKKAQQRKQVSSGVDLIDEDILGPNASSLGIAGSQQQISSSIRASTTSRSTHLEDRNRINTDYTNIGIGSALASVNDESNAVMRELVQRETVCRTRISVLQSTGKQFEKDINAFLQLMKAKEDGSNGLGPGDLSGNGTILSQTNSQMGNGGIAAQSQSAAQAQKSRLGYNRFDQERYGAKDETGGFVIDTKLTYQPNGGTISLTPNHNASTPSPHTTDKTTSSLSRNSSASQIQTSTQLTQQKTNIMENVKLSQSRLNPAVNSQKSRKSPIIIIPNTPTSLITMLNALDILQDLKFVSSDEKRKASQNQNAPKDCEIIMHKKEDGKNQQFKIVDNINKMLPQDWDRVVAVFAQGQQWQFKGWPFGSTNPPNPTEIFSKVKGFHLKMTGHPIDPNIAKWSVTVVELDPHKRHLDRARLLTLWDELDSIDIATGAEFF